MQNKALRFHKKKSIRKVESEQSQESLLGKPKNLQMARFCELLKAKDEVTVSGR